MNIRKLNGQLAKEGLGILGIGSQRTLYFIRPQKELLIIHLLYKYLSNIEQFLKAKMKCSSFPSITNCKNFVIHNHPKTYYQLYILQLVKTRVTKSYLKKSGTLIGGAIPDKNFGLYIRKLVI